VLTKKYVSAIPMSGSAIVFTSLVGDPPSRWYTCPDDCTVRTRIAMLNNVR